jgi:glycosyltransferase involved in cell wall biosynthesis
LPRICLIPNVSGTGGMVTFRHKLTAGLNARGIQVCHNLADEPYQAVLIIGGTRSLASLRHVKRHGIRLVQRLDGINWIQRKRWTGLRHFLRAELGNLLQSTIRSQLADRIIYQSGFARTWWQDWYGVPPAPASIIHNGVDLKTYTPGGMEDAPQGHFRLLVVEGSLGGGYDTGLENALALAEELNFVHQLPMELMVVGKVSPEQKTHWDARSRVPILWAGTVGREAIPALDRSAHLLFAADLHPACPNSVIEALACGLPVAAFDTGALKELLPATAGCIAPYGSDPWKLGKPDIPTLAGLAASLLKDLAPYRLAAREHAEQAFSLDVMVEKYLQVLVEVTQ